MPAFFEVIDDFEPVVVARVVRNRWRFSYRRGWGISKKSLRLKIESCACKSMSRIGRRVGRGRQLVAVENRGWPRRSSTWPGLRAGQAACVRPERRTFALGQREARRRR